MRQIQAQKFYNFAAFGLTSFYIAGQRILYVLGFFKMKLKFKLTLNLQLTLSIDHRKPWWKFLGALLI